MGMRGWLAWRPADHNNLPVSVYNIYCYRLSRLKEDLDSQQQHQNSQPQFRLCSQLDLTSPRVLERLEIYNAKLRKKYKNNKNNNNNNLEKTTNENNNSNKKIEAETISYQIKASVNLLPASSYRFQVSAVNGMGEGPRAAVNQTCVTPPSRPFRNPSGVCTDLRNRSQLVVVWQVASVLEACKKGCCKTLFVKR